MSETANETGPVILQIRRFFSLPPAWMAALNRHGRSVGPLDDCLYELPRGVYERLMGRWGKGE